MQVVIALITNQHLNVLMNTSRTPAQNLRYSLSNRITPKLIQNSPIRTTMSLAQSSYIKNNIQITSVKTPSSKIISAMESMENRLKQLTEQVSSKKMLKKKIKQETQQTEKIIDAKRKEQEKINDRKNTQQRILTRIKTSQPKPKQFHALVSTPYCSKNNNYYITEALRAMNQKNSLVMHHINDSIRYFQDCSYVKIPNNIAQFNIPRNQNKVGMKTLILDLDETLIHCTQTLQSQCDAKLDIRTQDGNIQIGINIRPYAMTFLKKMSQKFQIFIFTASQKSYADTVIDYLDPDGVLFSYRLYRHHCYHSQAQYYIKDLRKINRDLKDIILVDNAAYSYAFQIDNAIPILPYYQGKDFELSSLEEYLNKILKQEDVRKINNQMFKLNQYLDFKCAQDLVRDLYG